MSFAKWALALLASFWLAGCSDPNGPTRLDVQPQSLSFTAVEGAFSPPPAQTVQVTLAGAIDASPHSVVAGSGAEWLDVLPATRDGKSTSFQVGISETFPSLPAGDYTATIQIEARTKSHMGLHTFELPVTYTVLKPLVAAPGQLSFSAYSGQTTLPPSQTVTVTGDEVHPSNYSVTVGYHQSDARDWLTLPPAGTTPQTFSIGPRTTALAQGWYSATVVFTPDNGTPPSLVEVSYVVGAPTFSVTPARVGWTVLEGQGTLPEAQTVSVADQLGQAIPYTVTAHYTGGAQDWLLLPAAGTSPQGVALRPSTTTLPVGEYEAEILFTPQNGQPPARLAVTYGVRAPRLTVAPSLLYFTAFSRQSALPIAQTVKITGEQGKAVSYTVTASYAGSPQDWLTLPAAASTPQTLSLRPHTANLPPGQYSALLSFIPTNGQPATGLTVIYTVMASRLTVAPAELSFTASSGQSALPAAQTVNLTGEQGAAVSYTVTASYAGGPQGWLTLPAAASTPQALGLRPNTADLPPGQYSAVLSFTPTNGQPPVELTVHYSVMVPELRANPSAPAPRVDASTQEAGLTSLLALTSTGAPLDWRVVAVNASWLDATPVSGNTQSRPGLNLVVLRGALAGMDNGVYPGTVTLAYGNSSTPERQVDIPVELTLALPRVRVITPYAIEAGRSLSHILRGEGFSSLQSGQLLHLGTTTASTYQVISDSELRVTVPALPVGSHPVFLDNALGLARLGPNLYAVQTPAMPAVLIPHSRDIHRLIYDPRRTAFYTIEADANGTGALYRYRYSNGAWLEETYVTLPIIFDAVMDVDGQSLYMLINDGLYRLDLDDPTATPQYLSPTFLQYNAIQVMNDGALLKLGGSSCSDVTRSLDGRRALIMSLGCSSDRFVSAFDAGGTQSQRTPINASGPSSWIALDRTARYAFVQNAIYDAQWALVADASGLYQGIFSNDARRFFALHSDSAANRQTVRVYDVSTPPNGGRFPMLAEYTVAGAQPQDGFYDGGKVITPDDRTLILMDARQFQVIPIPPAVQ